MTQASTYDVDQALQAAGFIQSKFDKPPEAVVLTGTGLGDVAASAHIDTTIDYSQIPHFPTSSVQTHGSRLACGQWAGRSVIVMQGRLHLYEGYSAKAVAFPVRVMQCMGAKTLILTNAAGGLNPLFAVGDIMVIEDHINLTGENPLVGPYDERTGPRFPEMTQAYNGRLQELARAAVSRLDANVQAGVYAGLKGPSLETPAEMRFLHASGADAVGFSTVMEAIAGVQAGMQVLGISAITNMCLPDALLPASVAEIIETAQGAAPHIDAIISHVLLNLEEESFA